MNFLKLTSKTPGVGAIYLNFDLIIIFHQATLHTGSLLFARGDEDYWEVEESPDQILSMLPPPK